MGCVWFIYGKMELCYWLVHGNMKNNRTNKLNEKRLFIPYIYIKSTNLKENFFSRVLRLSVLC